MKLGRSSISHGIHPWWGKTRQCQQHTVITLCAWHVLEAVRNGTSRSERHVIGAGKEGSPRGMLFDHGRICAKLNSALDHAFLQGLAIKPIMQPHGCFHPSPAAGIHPAMEKQRRKQRKTELPIGRYRGGGRLGYISFAIKGKGVLHPKGVERGLKVI